MRRKVTASVIPTMVAVAALASFLPRSGPSFKLRLTDNRFRPQVLTVAVGESISIENDGATTHTFTCPACGVDTGDVQPGLTKVVTLRRAGRFEFFCRYHGAQGMVGQLIVGERSGRTPSPSPAPAASASP
jgi:plastocyanin